MPDREHTAEASAVTRHATSSGAQDYFGDAAPRWVTAVVAEAGAAGEDVVACLELAETYGACLPVPGGGQTGLRWVVFADVAAQNLTAARVLEAHADALAILAEAGETASAGRWGVFAAEAPQMELLGRRTGGDWVVEGTKPWCSLAARLDRALVSARVGSARQLFAVDLRHPSVQVDPPSGWVARGLREVPSGPVHFTSTPARPIGGPGWYLSRAGFAWGGIGVGACWYGGARALAERLHSATGTRSGDLLALSVGTVDVALHAAWICLLDAAVQIDSRRASGRTGELLALRVRSVIASAVEQTLSQVGHTLGPAPLAFDETHARRVADLQIYVRQHHAERDLADLGHRLLTGPAEGPAA